MIYQHEIDKKDFSCCLPRIIARLQGIGDMVTNHGYHKIDFFDNKDHFYAVGDIMTEAADDLQTINDMLYPAKDEHVKAA